MTQEIPGSEDTSSMLKFVDLLAVPKVEGSDRTLNILVVLPFGEQRKAAALQNKSTDHVRIFAVSPYGAVTGFRADVIILFHDRFQMDLDQYRNWIRSIYCRAAPNCVIIED